MKKMTLVLLVFILTVTQGYAFELFGYEIKAKTPDTQTVTKAVDNPPPVKKKDNAKEIEFLESLGILKTTTQLDASGSAIVMMMARDNTGVYRYQYITTDDTTDFETLLAQKGLIKMKINKKTHKPEKHIMVFNSKDKHTYVWVPLKEARAIGKQIKETGKTVIEPKQPRRLNTNDINKMKFNLSF